MSKYLFTILFFISISLFSADTTDSQRFKPSIGLKGMFVTETSETLDPFSFGGMLYLHYDKDPFVMNNNGEEEAIVGNVVYGDLLFSMGIIKNLEFGLAIPLSFYSSGTNPIGDGDFSKFSFGDMRVGLRYILPRLVKNLGVGFTLYGSIPTGDDESFNSTGSFALYPGILVDYKVGKSLLFAFNLSYLVRKNSKIGDIDQNDEVSYKLGAKYIFKDNLEFLVELFGSFQTTKPFEEKEESPLELLLASNYYLMNLKFSGGVALGVIPGVGTPLFRIIGGVGYVQRDPDIDKDGILNNDDKCPSKAEDKDGFEDEDGCPELDNDKDGILDSSDNCKNEAEDKDGFEDGDGCPDPDNDKDGILDDKDKCKNEAENVNGIDDEDGCPEIDTDKDGIYDQNDKCVDDPEDKDGFEDEDGCPDPDNDNDGIVDDKDKCPNKAEDKDKFEDEDGCPDLDNDQDGIEDKLDKCPNEGEVYNGFEDGDGCPDKGKKLANVNLKTKKIDILQKVYFPTASSKLSKRSYKLLKTVASIIKNNPQIVKVRVEGHTDDLGKYDKNITLSQRRAESVRNFLIKQGVKADRLEAKGYGPDKPLITYKELVENSKNKKKYKWKERSKFLKDLKDAREKNRRVGFTILDK